MREAEAVLRRDLKARPGPETMDAVSGFLGRRGRFAEAIDLLTRALGDRPKDEALLFTLATAYEQKGDVDQSLGRMRAVLEWVLRGTI
jgi:Flp pilus assembly protein TadD